MTSADVALCDFFVHDTVGRCDLWPVRHRCCDLTAARAVPRP
jgi:hypothetical protein